MTTLSCTANLPCEVFPKLQEDHHRIVVKLGALDADLVVLQKEVDDLKSRFQNNQAVDDDAHARLLEQLVSIGQRVENIDAILETHTSNEEDKFEQILHQLGQIHEKTQPLVTVYEDISGWVNINKAVVDAVKWLLPLVVGIGMSYVFFTK
jgi:adenylate kinase family enzyme